MDVKQVTLMAFMLASWSSTSTAARYSFCGGPPAYKQPPRGAPPDAVELKDDQFVKIKDESPVQMKAVNWFGFNNGQTALDGLWAGGNAAQMDFATIVYQLRLLGFNGVRLPFTFKDLKTPVKQGWIKQPCQQVDLAYLAQRTTDPAQQSYKQPSSKDAPQPSVPLPDTKTACNSYLPDTSTLDRYLWTVQWFVANGFYVLADYHPMGLDRTSYNSVDFVNNWKWFWSSLSCLPNFESDIRGRIFLDLINEPDSMGQRWEETPEPSAGLVPGITELYLKTMDGIERITPDAAIFFLEGAGQTGIRGVNWGNGFATDPGVVARQGLSDPNPFFKQLLTKRYRDRVVISPHVYGPSVTGLTDTYHGEALFKVLDASFGYLTKQGYCLEKEGGQEDCQRFPVAVGEFGSKFQDPRDLEHLNDFAAYLNNQGPGATGKHNAISNWYYWSYNANSGDTGGLVDDSWKNLMWVKLRWLRDKLGLKPWSDSDEAQEKGSKPTGQQSLPVPVPVPDKPTR